MIKSFAIVGISCTLSVRRGNRLPLELCKEDGEWVFAWRWVEIYLSRTRSKNHGQEETDGVSIQTC